MAFWQALAKFPGLMLTCSDKGPWISRSAANRASSQKRWSACIAVHCHLQHVTQVARLASKKMNCLKKFEIVVSRVKEQVETNLQGMVECTGSHVSGLRCFVLWCVSWRRGTVIVAWYKSSQALGEFRFQMLVLSMNAVRCPYEQKTKLW